MSQLKRWALSVALVLVLAPSFLHGRPSSTGPGRAGAPGDSSCAECHSAAPTNPVRVYMDFRKQSYTPSIRQKIFVYVFPKTGTADTGFELTARLASNPLLQAGTFESDSASVATKNGLQYIIGQNGQSFFWTPPTAGSGDVRFYATGEGGQAGDPPDGNVTSVNYTLHPTANRTFPSGYRIDLFNIPGSTFTNPTAIASDGTAAGVYNTSTVTSRGFLRTQAGGLATFDGFVTGVNNSGTVVGTNVAQSFIRTSTGTVTPFTIPSAQTVSLSGINDSGTVVGFFVDSAGLSNALFGTSPQSYQSFVVSNTLAGPGGATGISANGTIIGADNQVAFVRQVDGSIAGASPCDPPPLGASLVTHFLKLNDQGLMVGYCNYVSAPAFPDQRRFFADESGRLTYWPYTGNPVFTDINNNAQISGRLGNNGFTLSPCSVTVTTTSLSIGGGGGYLDVPISGTPSDCRPTVAPVDDWISFQNDNISGVLRLFLPTNPTGAPRTGTIIVGNTPVSINQQGVPCTYQLSGTSTMGSQGGVLSILINTSAGCPWNASSTADWLTFVNPQGTGAGSLQVNVAVNSSLATRAGNVRVGDQTITILQSGSPTCVYTVNPLSIQMSSSGGSAFVSVLTASDCQWTIVLPVSWLSTQTLSFTGSATALINVLPNFATDTRSITISVAGQAVTITQFGTTNNTGALRFVAITPCRIVDTRGEGGLSGFFGQPRMQANSTRDFPLTQSSNCTIPSNARAYSLNVTVVPPGYLGFLTMFPTGTQRPAVSTLNSWDGRVIANAAIVPAGSNGSVSAYVSNDTDVIMDINGYFVPVESGIGLSFYPVTPCRVSDTRPEGGKSGAFGPPLIATQTERSIPILGNGCNIPTTAQAYALNVTVVPRGYLGFLTVYPDNGLPRPLASTLNSWGGQVIANAALVPAGNGGSVKVYASNDTDVIVDINGYFALPGQAGALSFYPLTPCRVADTRPEGGKSAPFGPPALAGGNTREFPILQSGCNAASNAQAYSLNMTAVPQGYLGFLTVFPSGQTLPPVSTLNSWDGQVIANAALVPASPNGSINVYVSNTTNFIIDINGYFAP